MGEYALGQAVPRSEDPRLLSGGGRYVDDIKLPGMAYGWVVRSPYAAANIISIDTKIAKNASGVLAVLTGDDWKASGLGDMPIASGRKRADGAAMFCPPMPALIRKRARRVGDYVAFVVAETLAEAKDAAELIDIKYDILPAVTDAEAAISNGSPAVWDECPDNICFVHTGGDAAAVEQAFETAKHVITQKCRINRVMAMPMEPRGCTGDYNHSDEHYTLYTTLQGVHPYRTTLADKILKVPENKVRVVALDVGGSFGMKSPVYNEGPLCLWASKILHRPVKWMGDRSESFLSDYAGRDNITTASLALTAQGKFLGFKVETLAGLGAYIGSATPNPAINNLGTLAGVYMIPAISVKVTGVITNNNPVTPYRGAGRPEAALIIERTIDLAADKLNFDPAELRRLNTIPPEAMPYKTALYFTYDCGEFEKNMDITMDMADWHGFEKRRKESLALGKLRGIGMSNTIERAASPGFEAAEIRVGRSGTVTLQSGSCTQGQGHETVFKQIVADKLGIGFNDINYVWGDTDKVAFGHGTGGSRSSALGGSAVNMATDKVIEKAIKIAAHNLEAAPEDIELSEGLFTVVGTDKALSFIEVAKAAVNPNSIPKDMEPGINEQATYTADMMNYPNGCHICELEIDPDTGIIEILKYSVVDDVGTVMNPLLLKGQIMGGIVQGVGQALMEDVAYDENGQLITGSFMDYGMPRADNMSYMDIKSNPVPTKTNPLGVKGAGEAGNVGGLPAVMNAIIDALSPLGILHLDMPCTPEKIWRAIQSCNNKNRKTAI